MKRPSKKTLEAFVGCSGWYFWRWKGSFYPSDLPSNQWFKYYTTIFKTVELNAPFYHWPRPSTVMGWHRNAPPGFHYAVKVNGIITHEKRMVGTKRLIGKFYALADTLEKSMGCFLFQFPPSYRYSPARLRTIVAQLDPNFRNALEFRHPSWWRKPVYRAFAKAGLIFCSVSAPRLPEELVRTNDIIYVRLHGRSRWYRHDYSTEELTQWAEKIIGSQAREAWIFFNNDYDGCATRNALKLKMILRRKSALRT